MKNYPGGYDSLSLRELLDSVVISHVSKAISPEKMSVAERQRDLQFVKESLVQCAHFIRSVIEDSEGEYLIGAGSAESYKRDKA
ncbi:hypothetical protein PMPD1_2515 [Paramixta manurensis]|uniref:Uncharacterized protein n=1 Tax=Paramixta manurensis TaxID=2740817 RepID=A0A6M8UGB8_9GAMM|nr:hypothetical protein PMPD1_2515 [Erwiniaceae bacterium PD-1]